MLLWWGFKGVQEEIPSEVARTLLIESVSFPPVHNSIFVTDYLTKMGIKTVPQPPYSPDLASCVFWLFPKLGGCRYETIGEIWKRLWRRSLIRSHKRTSIRPSRSCWNGTTSALQQETFVFSRGLEFHMCTINKSAHTKEVWKLIVCASYTAFGLPQSHQVK